MTLVLKIFVYILIIFYSTSCTPLKNETVFLNKKEKTYLQNLSEKRVPILNKRSIELAKQNVQNYYPNEDEIGEISEISHLYKTSYKRLSDMEQIEALQEAPYTSEVVILQDQSNTNQKNNNSSVLKLANEETMIEELQNKIKTLEEELKTEKDKNKTLLIVPKSSEQHIKETNAQLLKVNSKILNSTKIYPLQNTR